MANVLRGMAAGMLAGLAASWVMNQFQQMHPQPGPEDQGEDGGGHDEPQERKENHAGSGLDEDATVQAAQAIAQRVIHRNLTDREKRIAGPTLHYAYGSLVGAMYGGLAELLPIVSAGVGLPFGFTLWLLGDEVAVPALGLAKGPTEYPPEAHADALAAHFMYGVTTDILRRVLRHVV